MSLLDTRLRDAADHDRLNYGVASRKATGFVENLAAGWDYTTTVWQTHQSERLKLDFINEDIERYEALTGEAFNVQDMSLTNEYMQGDQDWTTVLAERFQSQIPEELRSEFDPDYEGRVTDRMREAREDYEDTLAGATGMGRVGAVAGAMAGGMADPYILAASAVGGFALIGRGVSLARGVALEAALGAAVETAIQPSIAPQVRRSGEEYTWEDAVANVALAGVASGGFYAGLRGGTALTRTLRDQAAGVDSSTRVVLDLLANRLDEARLFEVGTKRDALAHFEAIDRTTASLISGRMVEPQRVDVTQVSFTPLRQMDANARIIARSIQDPELRAMYEESFATQRDLMVAEMRRIDNDALEVARQAARGKRTAEAAARLPEFEQPLRDLEDQVTGLERTLDGFRSGEMDVAALARFAPDPDTQGRLAAIAEDLAGARARDRTRLEREAEQIIETVRPEVERNLEAEIRDTADRLRSTQTERVRAAEPLRQIREYRIARRAEEEELAQTLRQKMMQAESGRLPEIPVEFAHDMTPYRLAVRDTRLQAQQGVEMTPTVMRDIEETRSVTLRETLAAEPERPVAYRDIETGEVRLADAQTMLRELDEDRDFIQAFRECRGGQSA